MTRPLDWDISATSSPFRRAKGETLLFPGNNFSCVLFPEQLLFKEATDYQGKCPRFQCQFFELSRSPRSPYSLKLHDKAFKKSLSCIWGRIRDSKAPIIICMKFLPILHKRNMFIFISEVSFYVKPFKSYLFELASSLLIAFRTQSFFPFFSCHL